MTNEKLQAFETFWAEWPKHVARKAAARAWSRIAPEEYPKILAALPRHKQQPSWNKDSGAYIPYPATWLNGERWKDEIVLSEDKDADLLLEALADHASVPPDFPQHILARFRGMCYRMGASWPRLHHELEQNAGSAGKIREAYLNSRET